MKPGNFWKAVKNLSSTRSTKKSRKNSSQGSAPGRAPTPPNPPAPVAVSTFNPSGNPSGLTNSLVGLTQMTSIFGLSPSPAPLYDTEKQTEAARQAFETAKERLVETITMELSNIPEFKNTSLDRVEQIVKLGVEKALKDKPVFAGLKDIGIYEEQLIVEGALESAKDEGETL